MANEANGLRAIMQDLHGHLDRHPDVDLAPLEKYFEHAEAVASELERAIKEREAAIDERERHIQAFQRAHGKLLTALQSAIESYGEEPAAPTG